MIPRFYRAACGQSRWANRANASEWPSEPVGSEGPNVFRFAPESGTTSRSYNYSRRQLFANAAVAARASPHNRGSECDLNGVQYYAEGRGARLATEVERVDRR